VLPLDILHCLLIWQDEINLPCVKQIEEINLPLKDKTLCSTMPVFWSLQIRIDLKNRIIYLMTTSAVSCDVGFHLLIAQHAQTPILFGRNSIVGELITVTARSKAWTVFACSNTGIVGSNPTWGMDVFVPLFCVCAVLRPCDGLITRPRNSTDCIKRSRIWKSGQGPTKDCRATNSYSWEVIR
jgi:hypothetical protein